MGLLATAGMISGMGQGLERGLQSLQTGIIQHGLQEDRFNKEATVRESEHSFQAEKLKEQLAHAERLQKQDQTFRTGETDRTIASHEKIAGDQLAQRSAEHENDYNLKNRELLQKGEALEETVKQKDRELGILEKAEKAKSGYYDAYRKYLLGGKSGASSTAKIDLDTRKAAAAFYSSRITPLEKKMIDPMTSETEQEALRERIEQLSREGLKILGVESEKAGSADPDIDDPFSGAVGAQEPGLSESRADAQRELNTRAKGRSGTGLLGTANPVEPNLPRMGNPHQYTPETVAAFLREIDEAKRSGGKISDVTGRYQKKFGRVPTQDELDEMTNAQRKPKGE